jgi:hypothetical protein
LALNAFKAGYTVLDEATMNSIIAGQPSSLIFDGTFIDSNNGSENNGTGVFEHYLSTSNYCQRFGIGSQTTIGRIELEVKKIGVGTDLTVEIRDNTFNINGSNDGVLLKTVIFPAKLFTTGYISLPIDLSSLPSSAYYWIRLNKAGDITNHLRWIGEGSSDANHPTYFRAGTSGVWNACYAAHFRTYANTPGNYILKHGIYGTNGKTWIIYDETGLMSYIWRWLPSADGTWKIAEKLTPTYDINNVAVKWGVS